MPIDPNIFKVKEKRTEEETDKVISEWKRSGDGRLVKTSLTQVVTERVYAREDASQTIMNFIGTPQQKRELRNVARKRARAAISSDSSPTLPCSKIMR